MVGRSDIAAQVSAAVQIGQGPVSLVNAAIYRHVARASQSSEVKYEHCCDVDHCPEATSGYQNRSKPALPVRQRQEV